VLEGWRAPFTKLYAPWAIGVPPVYGWLAKQPEGALVEMPIGVPVPDAQAMVYSARHWKPLVNGYSGFTPTNPYFRNLLSSFPSPASLRILRDIGVRWILIHRRSVTAAQAALCDAEPPALPSTLQRAYGDATECVFELVGDPPPAPPPPPDRPVSLAGATLTASAGTDTTAAHDDRLDTHWIDPIEPATEAWLQIDFPASHTITRLVVELGAHFGEFLRQWRVDTSLDGVTWTPATTERNGVPPLVGLVRDPSHLAQELRLTTPTPARHLRIVRPATDNQLATVDVWLNWTRWGVHELRVFEAPP